MEENAQKVEEREMTFGEDAVGISFNPGGDKKVNEVKKLYAEVIDMLNEIRSCDEDKRHPEKNRLLSVAITEAQTAQMWAVKGITK